MPKKSPSKVSIQMTMEKFASRWQMTKKNDIKSDTLAQWGCLEHIKKTHLNLLGMFPILKSWQKLCLPLDLLAGSCLLGDVS